MGREGRGAYGPHLACGRRPKSGRAETSEERGGDALGAEAQMRLPVDEGCGLVFLFETIYAGNDLGEPKGRLARRRGIQLGRILVNDPTTLISRENGLVSGSHKMIPRWRSRRSFLFGSGTFCSYNFIQLPSSDSRVSTQPPAGLV